MRTAIVTGASSGIGQAIAHALINDDYIVYGIGRTFNDGIDSDHFIRIEMDLTHTDKLAEAIRKIDNTNEITLLVNGAGVAYYAPHEELNASKIHEMVTVNLEVPMLISQLLLRSLKKNNGTIINISSVTAKKDNNTYGCVYGATKAGLTSFGNSLFEEARKYGVKVVNIHPDMTNTSLYRNATFEACTEPGCCLYPEDISDVIKNIIHMRDGIEVSDVTLRPQFHRLEKKGGRK